MPTKDNAALDNPSHEMEATIFANAANSRNAVDIRVMENPTDTIPLVPALNLLNNVRAVKRLAIAVPALRRPVISISANTLADDASILIATATSINPKPTAANFVVVMPLVITTNDLRRTITEVNPLIKSAIDN